MSIFEKIKPKFWDHYDVAAGTRERPFSFRRKWKLIVLFTSAAALAPLLVMTSIDYRLTRGAVETEAIMGLSETVSNAWRAVSFFLEQREFALDFVARDNTEDALLEPGRLRAILKNLKTESSGFTAITLVDSSGAVRGHAGAHRPVDSGVRDDSFFESVVKDGKYIGDVAIDAGGRRLVMAISRDSPGGRVFILRADLDVEPLCDLMSSFEIDEKDDAFIIGQDGEPLTPSLHHDGRIGKIDRAAPGISGGARVMETKNKEGEPILLGWAPIPGTPFFLVIAKRKAGLMAPWFRPRMKLIGFLVAGIAVVLLAILGSATYLVNRIHTADRRRVEALHQVEYANKLASLGRLASGVAHEINNPLAIINQKAGLIKDLFTYREEYAGDVKLMELVDAVSASVERCGSITRRLLNFALHMDSSIHPVDLEKIIREVLRFLEKEAERRRIEIVVDLHGGVPEFESDRGGLQQVFLNLFNNAFTAMEDGGRLEISIKRAPGNMVSTTVEDNGCGIPKEDLKRVFEPFFAARSEAAGTGLGLSITYGLIKKLGGDIQVRSEVGKGTCFTILLPLKTEQNGRGQA